MSLPKPYFTDGRIVLYRGDAKVIFPQLTERPCLVVTDPPYGAAYQSNHRTVSPQFDKIHGDEAYDLVFLRWLIEQARSATYAFCRWDNIPEFHAAGLMPHSLIAACKNNWSMGNLDHTHGRQWEGCAFWAGAEHKWGGGWASA